MSRSKRLRERIKDELIPFFEEKGFRVTSRKNFFTTLERKRGDIVEFMEIQYNKYWRPKFTINLKETPPPAYHYSARFQANKSASGWFKVGFLQKLISGEEKAITALFERIKAVYPQVEEWFESKKAGPNIQFYRFNGNQVIEGP